MSKMYRAEVPQYGTLLELVADVNARTLEKDAALKARLEEAGELEALSEERHGAIRVGESQCAAKHQPATVMSVAGCTCALE